MQYTLKHLTMTLVLLSATAFGTAFAAGGGGGGGGGGTSWSSTATDPIIATAQDAIKKRDWTGAQQVLKNALSASPDSADYHNLYAYTVRKGPNPDMAVVFEHYNTALRINPEHKNALEYMGEAYLMVDQPEKAKENLKVLDGLCFFGCSQYTDLKKAIADYEASHK